MWGGQYGRGSDGGRGGKRISERERGVCERETETERKGGVGWEVREGARCRPCVSAGVRMRVCACARA